MFFVEILGRAVPAVNSDDGVRALRAGKPVSPDGVERYLEGKFGDRQQATRSAMQRLARHFPPKELAGRAYALCEQFRPAVPEGVKGWGAKGEVNLSLIAHLSMGDSVAD
jgi:hypothetical protein